VVDQGGSSLLKPLVKVFHCARRNAALPPLMLDLGDPAANDAIVAREKAVDWGLPHTDEMWMQA
jgi:hypothetical protein